ncbi:hypothetical protein [Streptomyces sp. DHE17-7]|uniref:hypothetical protein n=1 Tax=Streptomyces sp. DHE17-7 TaxID=2759949 RepID=UPI0022EAD71C|nr:hypothetical protein [Streptomyces sp. DHE17-7]
MPRVVPPRPPLPGRGREGDVWRRMEIAERHEETPDAVSLVLRPADGRPAPSFRPGQYVGVRSSLPDGSHQIRRTPFAARAARLGAFTVKAWCGVRPR